jgi:hypothetical protein
MQVAVEKGGWELYIYTRYTTFLRYLPVLTYHDAYVTLRYLGYNHLSPYPSIHPSIDCPSTPPPIHPAIRSPATLLHRLIPFLPPFLPSFLPTPPTQPQPQPPLPAATTHAPVHGAVRVKDRYRYGPYGRPCAGVCTQQLCGAMLGGQHVGCAVAGAGVCIWG